MNTRWKDLDALGHINNSIYLTYFENARIDLFKQWGFSNIPPFIMVSAKIDYIKELIHPSILSIGNKISRLGNTSLDILSAIYKDNDTSPTTIATITIVYFDYKKKQPVTIPNSIRKYYKNL